MAMLSPAVNNFRDHLSRGFIKLRERSNLALKWEKIKQSWLKKKKEWSRISSDRLVVWKMDEARYVFSWKLGYPRKIKVRRRQTAAEPVTSPLRSTVSSPGCVYGIYRVTWRETDRRFAPRSAFRFTTVYVSIHRVIRVDRFWSRHGKTILIRPRLF